MGKAKQTRKFAVAKRMMSPNDTRVRKNLEDAKAKKLAKQKKEKAPRQIEQANTSLFFQYNEQLGPPYHVLVDTNFINFSIRWVKVARVTRALVLLCVKEGLVVHQNTFRIDIKHCILAIIKSHLPASRISFRINEW